MNAECRLITVRYVDLMYLERRTLCAKKKKINERVNSFIYVKVFVYLQSCSNCGRDTTSAKNSLVYQFVHTVYHADDVIN